MLIYYVEHNVNIKPVGITCESASECSISLTGSIDKFRPASVIFECSQVFHPNAKFTWRICKLSSARFCSNESEFAHSRSRTESQSASTSSISLIQVVQSEFVGGVTFEGQTEVRLLECVAHTTNPKVPGHSDFEHSRLLLKLTFIRLHFYIFLRLPFFCLQFSFLIAFLIILIYNDRVFLPSYYNLTDTSGSRC